MKLPRILSISIRSRIALTVLAASALVLTVMSFAVYLEFKSNLKDSFNQDLQDRAASYASLVDVGDGSASLPLGVDPRRERAQGEALVRLFDPAGQLTEDGSPASGGSPEEASLVQRSSSASAEITSTLSYSDGEEFRVVATPIFDSNNMVAVLVTGLETSKRR